MANNKWKPLYEYKVSFSTQIGIALGYLLTIALFGVGVVTFLFLKWVGIVFIVLGSLSGYIAYSTSSPTIIQELRKYKIESFCKKDGMVLARTASQKMGLFTTTGYLIIKPEYRNIIFRHHYYLLEDQRGLWGAYNASLSKQVIECEYSSIQVEDNENITVVKDDTRYTYSPYGSLIHKVNVDADDLLNKIMGRT